MKKNCKYCNKEFNTKNGHNQQIYCCKSCSIKDRHVDDIGLFRSDVEDYIQKYILGLIITDGCISKNGNRLYICISLKDEDMISKIHDLVCPNKKIYKDGNNYQIKWRNDRDIQYLYNLGIHERKTFDVILPLFDCNMWHLVRGIFDGDGCVYHSTAIDRKYNREYTYSYVSFTTASISFATELNRFLQANNIKSKIYEDKRTSDRKNKTFYIKILNKRGVCLFKELMYKECEDWFLMRKYSNFV